MKPAFQSIVAQVAHERDTQKYKYGYSYSVSDAIPNGLQKAVELTIEKDADFLCQRLTIAAYGPTDMNGVRQVAALTDFPLAGVATGYADRGLSVDVKDNTGRQLTKGFVPLELFGAPGNGVQLHMPYPYNSLFTANSIITFNFNNRDTVANFYHYVTVAMHGYKYALGEGSVSGQA